MIDVLQLKLDIRCLTLLLIRIHYIHSLLLHRINLTYTVQRSVSLEYLVRLTAYILPAVLYQPTLQYIK